MHAPSKRLDVERLRVLPVDPVADAAQPDEIAQVLFGHGGAAHAHDPATVDGNRAGLPAGSFRSNPAVEQLP